jgi:colanic acid biosynthesis glycosyl transferase WcaI
MFTDHPLPEPGARSLAPGSRVIFVNRVYWPYTAATAQLLTDLAEGLAVRGWTVHVITSGEGTAPTERNGVHLHPTGQGALHDGLLSRALNYRRFTRAAGALLDGLVRPGDIVVAMTDPPMLGAAVTRVATARGARVVHWIQDVYPEIASTHFGPLAAIALSRLKARRNAAWQTAAACVPLGEDMARFISTQDVPRGQITILANWAPRELHTPAPGAEVAAHRDRWGLADKFIVAYSGNLGRVHEFATILDAAALLADEQGILFLFIGSGARFDEVAATARRRNLANVRLFPAEPRSGLTTSLRAADAHLVSLRPAYARLVYPSKLAGVLAASRPVLFIGPPESEIARLLRQYECGDSVAPGEASALAMNIRRLAADATLRQHQGKQARVLYEQKFTGDAALAGWDRLLRELPVGA